MTCRPAVGFGRSPSRLPEKPGRSEAGDTLIELLIAVAVLGVTGVAILLGFTTSILASAQYRNLATIDTVLRSAVAEATTQMQQSASSPTSAFACPTTFKAVFSLPPGYTALISAVGYWNGATWVSTCTPTAPQLITVAAMYNGTAHSITSVVGDPLGRPVPPFKAATHLVFLALPASGIAGSALYPAPAVAVEDANGNLVTSDLSPVMLGLTGSNGAILANCSGNEFYGLVSFTNCDITTAGKGYTLTATDQALTPAPASLPFDITAGPATQLVFATTPYTGTAGSPIPNVAVQVVDIFGNLATASGSVAVTITNGPQTGFTSGTTTANVSSGIATFPDLVVNTSGVYSLTASPSGISGVTHPVGSGLVNVAPAAVSSFSLANPRPGTQTAGTGFSETITAVDAYGNTVTSYAGTKAIAFSGPATSPAPILTPPAYPTSITFTAGTAATIPITLFDAQTTTLTATDTAPGGVAGTSPSFTVAPTPVRSFSLANPATQTAGTGFNETITALDAYGNTATSYNGTKTTIVFSGPATSPAPAFTPPAYPTSITFTAGTAATIPITLFDAQTTVLTATDPGVAAGTSQSFTVGYANFYAGYLPTPSNVKAGTPYTIMISAIDYYGNTVTWATGSFPVTFSGPGSSPNGTAPLYPASLPFSNGVATTSITFYAAQTTSLTTSASGISGTTPAFTVAPAAVSSFSMANPATQTAGNGFNETITALDAYGNTATSYAGTKTTIVFSGPATSPAPASTPPAYPRSVAFTAGIAATIPITLFDAQTTALTATDPGVAAGTSQSFTVGYAGLYRASNATPSTVTAGSPFTVTITAIDLYGNTITGASGSTSVTFSGPGNSSNGTAPLYPTSLTFNNGVATPSVTLYAAQTTSLAVTAFGLTGSTPSFTVVPAVASSEVFTTQPRGATAINSPFPIPPVVTAEDSYGNTVDSSNPVTLAPSTTTGTLGGCTTAVTQVHGVATFSGCTWSSLTTGAKIRATAGSFTVTSGPFNITGPATKLVFTTPPAGSVTGAPLGTQPVVTVEDAQGNAVTADTSSVTLAITVPAGASLTCTSANPLPGVSGVAAFAGCVINKTGTYSLSATDGSLTAATSPSFAES